MASKNLKNIDINISSDIQSGYDYSLIVTGVTGSGKSTFCNFLCCSDKLFEAHSGFASVTSKSATATITMQGKRVELIDTPGFCDDYETEEEHMQEFGEAMVLASRGVNAIALLISAKARYTSNEANTIKYMTEFPEMWGYMFIIFTNAGSLGANEQEQEKELKDMFQQERCPESLKYLLRKVNDRYILVESFKPSSDPEAYYLKKTEQLQTMITKLNEANNNNLYTNALFRRAKELIDKLIKDKEMDEKELKNTIEQTKIDVQKREEDKKNTKKAKEETEKAKEELEKAEKEERRKSKLLTAEIQKDVEQKQKEKAEVKQEFDKRFQEKLVLEKEMEEEMEEQRKRKITQEAQEEAVKILSEQLVKEHRLNDELKGKRDRKWYKVVIKKTTGKDCVIQ